MSIITRFAPSPTGFLHIGGARTALFNWLYTKNKGGKFLLRIEDTDQQRSTQEAVDAILEGLKWLEIDWEGEPVFQLARAARHAEVANEMLKRGNAYHCYASPQELEEMRQKATAEGRQPRYDGRWRDRDPKEAPPGVKPVIRLKAPQTGSTTIQDHVEGEVTVNNEQLDDLILLRADGTPTYNLAVVVDDHDMNITHVIRGDDHLNNAFRQKQIYEAMNWKVPEFAHLPLIHGPDGSKMSKRHGTVAVGDYAKMGFLPEAMRNYLLRLGWSHGDDEIISTDQAIKWFDLSHIGKNPARFDIVKLQSLNAHYIRIKDDAALVKEILPRVKDSLGYEPDQAAQKLLLAAMPALKPRAKTLIELAEMAVPLIRPRPLPFDDKAQAALTSESKIVLKELKQILSGLPWQFPEDEKAIKMWAEGKGLKLNQVFPPLRAALTGTITQLPISDLLGLIGKNEVIARLEAVI
ncbi:MAG: glutamate--tRNA ligase [Dongiaceae bacterium]